jgi:hypothetical protein
VIALPVADVLRDAWRTVLLCLGGTVLAHRYPGAWWPLAVFDSSLAGVSLVCIGTLERRKRARRMAPSRRLKSAGVPRAGPWRAEKIRKKSERNRFSWLTPRHARPT